MTVAQEIFLRRELGGSIEGRATAIAGAKILVASVLLGLTAYGVWWLIDGAVGDAGVLARSAAVLPALAAGTLVYIATVFALRVAEAEQIRALITGRVRRSRPA